MIFIGATGHRVIAYSDALIAGINRVFDRILHDAPQESWTMISSLAEGADRLVVKQALIRQPSTRLIVPLPLPVEDYLLDFPTPESRREFLEYLQKAAQVIDAPQGTTRPDAYKLAGHYVLQHSQVLIALWDGKEAQGVGGTAEIVFLARRMKLPLAWVYCLNRSATGYRVEGSASIEGKVRFYRFARWQEVNECG